MSNNYELKKQKQNHALKTSTKTTNINQQMPFGSEIILYSHGISIFISDFCKWLSTYKH